CVALRVTFQSPDPAQKMIACFSPRHTSWTRRLDSREAGFEKPVWRQTATLALLILSSSSGAPMTSRKELVDAYFEGFRRSDHAAILSLLTEDVIWDVAGFKHLEGKVAFDGEIENPAFE